jgi:hypothetical protein
MFFSLFRRPAQTGIPESWEGTVTTPDGSRWRLFMAPAKRSTHPNAPEFGVSFSSIENLNNDQHS